MTREAVHNRGGAISFVSKYVIASCVLTKSHLPARSRGRFVLRAVDEEGASLLYAAPELAEDPAVVTATKVQRRPGRAVSR